MNRRFLLVLLGSLIAVISIWTGLLLVWRGRYEGEIERIRAAGHPAFPSDLEVPECVDEDNMLPLLQEAAAYYDDLEDVEGAGLDWSDLFWFGSYEPGDARSELDEEQARAVLAHLGPYFDMIRRATRRPRLVVGPEYSDFSEPVEDAVERLRTRSVLEPEHCIEDAACVFRMALALEPARARHVRGQDQMVRIGLGLLRRGLANGDTPGPELAADLDRLDPMARFRSSLVLQRAEAVAMYERLRAGKHPFAGYEEIEETLEESDLPSFGWLKLLGWRVFRPLVYWRGSAELGLISDWIDRLESGASVQSDWRRGTGRRAYRHALGELKEIRVARLAVAIACDGAPPADLPLDPLTGKPIRCTTSPDGYRIDRDWLVPTRP